MDSLVPSFISIDGIAFPLHANPLSVGLAPNVEELEVLRFVVDEMVNGDHKSVPIETLAREGFRVQELAAIPVTPTMSLGSLSDGPIGWRRVSGGWPDLGDAFFLRSGFLARDLVLPRQVLVELVKRLRVLRDEILEGKREGRVASGAVPPTRPLTPELAEYEALRKESREDAWAYMEELYARRG